jgi:methyl-accepting chemotaxis protein
MHLPFGLSDNAAFVEALGRSQAVIEFDLDGKILTANENFCRTLGYDRSEIVGRHHSMFVDKAEAASPQYRAFWDGLRAGRFDRGQYRRIGKDGRDIWIEASYNPLTRGGKPYKIVKTASDITAVKNKAVEDAGKLDAISRSQAVIEFTPDGTILTANENFCATLDYRLADIEGRHHAMFCDPAYTATQEYRDFWKRLAEGEFISNEFLRFGRGGKQVWIQAAYNPIVDASGKVVKVVKFATDVTTRMAAIGTLAQALRRLAEGDLAQRLDEAFVPTMEGVRLDFNRAVSTLREAMTTVGESADGIKAGAGDMAAAASTLSRRSETQAASVEETAAALEQITTAVGETAGRANTAAQLASKTKDEAQKSLAVVDEAVAAMASIEKSSRDIGSILSVIDDIAFQTNLLALNAGVEAARAGDAGRGFAVVAQEVRALAQRSATSAKEIKQLIADSSRHVEKGVGLVGETGRVLTGIVGHVVEVAGNIEAIVVSTKEQASGLKEVNHAVNLMDQGTQENASMAERSHDISHRLADGTAELFELLARFKVAGPKSENGVRQQRVA